MTELITYPMNYGNHYARIHKKCQAELKDLVDQSGHKGAFMAKFIDRLNYLMAHYERAVQHREWFESLQGSKDLYSMRFIRIDNIRILYTIRKPKVYLLCAFKEVSDKKGGESYQKYIPIAMKRMNETLEEESE